MKPVVVLTPADCRGILKYTVWVCAFAACCFAESLSTLPRALDGAVDALWNARIRSSGRTCAAALFATLCRPSFFLEFLWIPLGIGLLFSQHNLLLAVFRRGAHRRLTRWVLAVGVFATPLISLRSLQHALPVRDYLVARELAVPGTSSVARSNVFFLFDTISLCWLIGAALFALCLFLLAWIALDSRSDSARCPRCSYDLAGIDAPRNSRTCPECGSVFGPAAPPV